MLYMPRLLGTRPGYDLIGVLKLSMIKQSHIRRSYEILITFILGISRVLLIMFAYYVLPNLIDPDVTN